MTVRHRLDGTREVLRKLSTGEERWMTDAETLSMRAPGCVCEGWLICYYPSCGVDERPSCRGDSR